MPTATTTITLHLLSAILPFYALNHCTMRILNSWVSKSNPTQQTIQFAGSVSRAELPTGFASQSSNPLVAISQGGAGEMKYTVLWSYSKELYEARGGELATIQDLFPDVDPAQVQPHLVRCTIQAWDDKEPVTNPKTGEVLMYEGKPVYQYESLTVGDKPKVEFTGHNAPSFIRVTDVAS